MSTPLSRTVGHHVREAARIAPGRPALWLGLRVALATAVPLVVAPYLDGVAAAWAPLAGFSVALVDKGGAYRTRAIHLTAVAIAAIIGVLAGTAVAGHGMATGAIVAVALGIASFAQAWGPTAISVGNTFAIQLLVAGSLPGAPGEVVQRAVGVAAGAAFAIALSLIVWPVRVYKPGRRAVAAMLDALADHARALAAATGDATWRDGVVARHRGIRDRIEVARAILAATRRGRRGDSGRGERLLAMVQAGDQLFGILIGIEELIDAGAPERDGLADLADGLAEVAHAVVLEKPARLADPVAASVAGVFGALIARAHADRAVIVAIARSLHDDSAMVPSVEQVPELATPTFGEIVREALDRDAFAWRHALRVAVVVVVAMAIARGLDLSHRYWVTLNVFLLLQPAGAATRIKAVQRVAGTVAGGLLAAAIPFLVDDPRIMIALVVVLAGASASVLSLNYALYATFLTPTFVLLAEAHAKDVHLVGVRIVNTLLGAGLAIGGALVFRQRESARFDDELADALVAGAAYVDEVFAAIASATPQPSTSVIRCRRAFGIALNRAELALDRVVVERAATSVLEPRMTELVFLRRLGSAITALGGTRGSGGYAAHAVPIAAFGASASGTLREVATAVRAATRPPPRTHVDRAIDDPTIAARLVRIDRILANLTDAARRA